MTTVLRPSNGAFSQTDYRRFVGSPVVSAEQLSAARAMLADINFAPVSAHKPFTLDDNCRLCGKFNVTAHALASLAFNDSGSVFIKANLMTTAELASASVPALAQHRGAIDYVNRLIVDGGAVVDKHFAYIGSTSVVEWIGKYLGDSHTADVFDQIVFGFPEYEVVEISVYSNAVEIRLIDRGTEFKAHPAIPVGVGHMSAVVSISKYKCKMRCSPSVYFPRKKTPMALVTKPLSGKRDVYSAMQERDAVSAALSSFEPKIAAKKMKIPRLVPYINLLVATLAKSLANGKPITNAHYITALMSVAFQDGRPRLLCERAAYGLLIGETNG